MSFFRDHGHFSVSSSATFRRGVFGCIIATVCSVGCVTEQATSEKFVISNDRGVRIASLQTPSANRHYIAVDTVWLLNDPVVHADTSPSHWVQLAGIAFVGDTLAVLDAGASQVHLYSLDGTLVNSFGGVGRGPGELISPYGITSANSRLVVGDSRGLHIWHSNGAFEETQQLGVLGFNVISRGENGALVVGLAGSTTGFVSYDLITREIDEFQFAYENMPEVANGGPCWRTASSPDGLIQTECQSGIIREWNNRGELGFVFDLGMEPEPYTEEELATIRETMRRRVASVGLASEAAVSSVVESQMRNLDAKRKWWSAYVERNTSTIYVVEQENDFLFDDGTIHVLDRDRYYGSFSVDANIVAMVVRDSIMYAITRDMMTGDLAILAARLTFGQ